MKKFYILLGVLSILYSCSGIEELPDIQSLSSEVTTRLSGDGKYDVLGFGYDVTGEYLHPKSVRNPILDIDKYKQEHEKRIVCGTSSFGFDKMYYGYSSFDYIKDITTETNATLNMNYGSEKDTTFFSGNISNNSYLKTEYSYSGKYSFASLDLVRNRKYIRFNDEISSLSQYLSAEFKEDLDRLSPARVVERYGTHVITDFLIGGRYKLMFKSVITNTKDASTKRQTVHSGFAASLNKIGISYNLESSETVYESLAKENQSKELYVLFYGGIGTNVKYDLEKGAPTSVDVQGWENSVSLENSCLTEITWKETYPIYEFISDPIKKAEIKNAVINYIASKQLKTLEVVPLYQYSNRGSYHYNTQLSSLGWNRDGVVCYVLLQKGNENVVPLYQFEKKGEYHYNTETYSSGWTNQRLVCFVYTSKVYDELIPLYQYSNDKWQFHYNTETYSSGWTRQGVVGYVFP